MIAQPLPQPLPKYTDSCCSSADLFFSPIRYCGRQYMWLRNDSNNNISNIALKIIISPFLACATPLATAIAIIGALFIPKNHEISYTKYFAHGSNCDLLRKDRADPDVTSTIVDRIKKGGLEDVVRCINIKSIGRQGVVDSSYYPDYVGRYIVLTGESTRGSRFCKVITNHFWNKDVSTLTPLLPCILGNGTVADWTHLKDVLDLYETVNFNLPLDLAYAVTTAFRCTTY